MTATILIVDDEPDLEALVLQKFRRQIREGAIDFLFARDGLEALAKLVENPDVDMVVSDINMPQMDGLDLLAQIKQRWSDLPVMMVTAYGDEERRRRASELGAFEFLTKPVDFDLLKTRLAQLPRAA